MRLGVDLQSVSRFARIARHERYRTLVFTGAELAGADRLGERRHVEWLAGRFCAKEAAAKVLGRGFWQGLLWRDIEVVSDEWGAPVVTLSGGARRIADSVGIGDIAVTLSHHNDLVVCVATGTRAEE
jgi:holo-[acyl-carrier protein] synthase